MGEPHVISALVRKRAELAGELLRADKVRQRIKANLQKIDRSLALFGYSADPTTIKPIRKQSPRLFKKGQLRRMIHDLRRSRPDLITNDAIAAEVVRRMKWNSDDCGLNFIVSLKVRDVRKANGG
jgi:hypothetical protein